MTIPRRDASANQVFAEALLAALEGAGVQDLCICPGSRSAPLVAAAARTRGLRRFVHVDERAAAFFALGLAKARRAPVALLCTSGTAAAHFLPALLEASLGGTPLIVLTADRPPELRGFGAPQTIDQLKLFGDAVRWFADLPVPGAGAPGAGFARDVAGRAVHEATRGRPGPVHLNLPFREPLHPTGPVAVAERAAPPGVRRRGDAVLAPDALEGLAVSLGEAERGVILCGPNDATPALAAGIAALGRQLGWPVLAEATSTLRFGEHTEGAPILSGGETILSCDAAAASFAPDRVLRFGPPPTGKATQRWVAEHDDARLVIVDPDGASDDPLHCGAEYVHADPMALCAALAGHAAIARGRTDPAWLSRWWAAAKVASDARSAALGDGPFGTPHVARALDASLPEGASLYVANSRAVRDWDAGAAVSQRALRVLSQRGANGIDGSVSAALGASAALDPMFLWLGDLAFLHDASGLLAAERLGLKATIVVTNDGGGGIFDALPIASHGDAVDFEGSFRVAHERELAPIAAAYGVAASRATSEAALRGALAVGAEGVRLIEVPVDAADNQALHATLQARVDDALEAAAPWR